jgi:hypothetical protein
MLAPDRTGVEGRQLVRTRCHVRESTQPDEAIRLVEIAELADEPHPEHFLALDELTLEEGDERLPRAGLQRVLAEFEDGQHG